MKKAVSMKVSDEEISEEKSIEGNTSRASSVISFGSTTPLSSARSSASSNGEYEAILAMLSGPPLKYKPILKRISIAFLVLIVSALILLAPVLIVWGINTKNMDTLSTQRMEEALTRRAESVYSTISFATTHCEKLILDQASWMQGLPRTGDEFMLFWNATSLGWTTPARDSKCGGAITVFLNNGALFVSIESNTSARLAITKCLTCGEQSYNLNPTTGEISSQSMGPGGPPTTSNSSTATQPDRNGNNLYSYIDKVENVGGIDQLNQLYPVWGKITPESNVLFVELFMALKRNTSSSYPPSYDDPISGLLRLDIKSYTLTAALASAAEQSGIIGSYVVEPSGYIIGTTLEDLSTQQESNNSNPTNQTQNNTYTYNSTNNDNTTRNNTSNPFGKIILANESSVKIVRESYALIPANLSAEETRIFSISGYPIAYTKLVTEYGFEATIVTIGNADYFTAFSRKSNIASGITLGLSIFFGGLVVIALSFAVNLGLNSIKKAVNWVIEDQLDNSAKILRSDDGEFDQAAVERFRHAKYRMKVYFSEMNAIGQSVEKLAISNRELKAFFPSMFVGLSKEEIKSGAHKTNLRCKSVSVMFVDIVKFSAICAENEDNLELILQSFFGILESPVFKKRGLTKRLGDGFMAAFGFATPDNDFHELCKRAHDCTRIIVRNLPKLNKQLNARLPFFPAGGLRIRIGLSAGNASIGVVQTDAMSNADVYGHVVNLGQRMEDCGRYKGIALDHSKMIPFLPEETPRCVITMTPEVYQSLESHGEFAKYGVEGQEIKVLIKGETEPRLAYRCIAEDLIAPSISM